ncbi:MAG: hypothetical protein KBD01_14970 [Acidobacteria bacterium]|nr:hypothetical protein [Acidobacteriota bacterium]
MGPRSLRRALACACSVVLVAGASCGADAAAERGVTLERLLPGATFDPAIPAPEAATGVRPGARPLRPDELLAYMLALDTASPRARWIEYARSHEGRPLGVLAVADEAALARLEQFQVEHARLADPRGRAPAEDAALAAPARAVAWMTYGIHGDELSSCDAAAVLAYWLVAGEDERARTLRRELVVFIDPTQNPDGRARAVAQAAAFAHLVPNADGSDLSHAGVWPWGRGNHYLFDLNRDWISQVHPESARAGLIAAWSPQLFVDSHEMGADSSYLFSPARHPFNPFRPARQQRWAERFAADQARALDGRGYSYYTREWNEEFFPGYGSAWASYLGAVGILYEMSSTDGTLVRQRPGTIRTFAEAIEHQLTSSVANLETLAANRAEVLLDSIRSRRDAVQRGAEGPVRAWLLPRGRFPARTDALAALLARQGIEVLRNAAAVQAAGVRDARTGETKSVELPAGSWLVPMAQPAGSLARALLDPHVPMEAAFFREEREYLERGKDSRLYDATAWSLPLLHGVEAYWSPVAVAGAWTAAVPEPRQGSLRAAAGAVAYVIDGSGDEAAPALADLLQRGIAVRVAEKEFRAAGRDFGPGTLLVKREGNPADLAAQLAEVAARWPVQIEAVATGKSERGPDLGGNYFHPLVAPRVGVWSGSPVNPGSYGFAWHLFDEVLGLRFAGLDVNRFGGTDLSRYNVLVFPPAFGGGYRERLGEKGLAELRRWIEAGGTAIGVGDGAAFLAAKDAGLTATRLRHEALDRFPPVVWGISADAARAGGSFDARGELARPAEPVARPATAATAARSPYDVAPVLGPGARPFAQGFEQGSPVAGPPVALAEWLEPLLSPGKERPDAEDLARADERLRRFAPQGALVRLELDPDSWLAWGLPAEVDVLVATDRALVAEPPVNVAARFAPLERLHLGGLLWPEAAGRLARTAYVAREKVGRGQVILFVDDPLLRGWTIGTRRLFENAVLFGPGLGTAWSSPW